MYLLNSQLSKNRSYYIYSNILVTLKRDIKTIQEENQLEVQKIQKYNHMLIEKLERGKQKYEKICKKYKDLKTNEQQAQKIFGNLLDTVSSSIVRIGLFIIICVEIT